ncbi:hypothetical protein [Streptomyces sp. enrichment culture]|uniref:hypothetical protein n=1 Tax=Streptomyces sp. enrichment culture TaxID=1795815 RepID=UPI003F57E9DE
MALRVDRPISDLPDSNLAVAWPQDARSPAVTLASVRAACSVTAVQQAQAESLMQNTAP